MIACTIDSPLGPIRLVAHGGALRAVHLVAPGPLGPIRLVADDRALCGAQPVAPASAAPCDDRGHPVLREAAVQLHQYFAGARHSFELPLDPRGTPFQRRVWAALLRVPFGERRSYGELARAIGQPAAVRAVGAANGRNPLAVVVPCHRVIGHDGSLVGYAGGLEAKRWLLAHEAAPDVHAPAPDAHGPAADAHGALARALGELRTDRGALGEDP